jgi:hypothetical protein
MKNEVNISPKIDELIPLREAAELSSLTQAHLALLIRKGYMWGKKIGRNWVTTARAVNEYLALGNKPGPKPQKKQK